MLRCCRALRFFPLSRSMGTKKKRPVFNPRPNQPLHESHAINSNTRKKNARNTTGQQENPAAKPKPSANLHAGKTSSRFTPRPPSTPPPKKQFKPKPPSSPRPQELQAHMPDPRRTSGLASATAVVLFGSFFTLSVCKYVNFFDFFSDRLLCNATSPAYQCNHLLGRVLFTMHHRLVITANGRFK